MKKENVPEFRTSEEFDEWVETHDTSGYALEDAPEVKIRPRKKPVTMRIYPVLIEEIKAIAKKRKMPYQSLVNQWLIEKVAENRKRRDSLSA